MANGLLSSALNFVDRKKQEIGAGLSLLASNPQEWATQKTSQYFPTKEESRQYDEVLKAGGDVTQTPYYQKIFNLSQFKAPTVYHGSPHIFGKFDLSKVGTGSKNQAQGYGVYLSESKPYAETFARETFTGAPNVAYRTQLAGNDPIPTLKAIYPNKSDDWYAQQVEMASRKGNLYTVDLPDKYLKKMIDYDAEIKGQSNAVKSVAKKLGLNEDDLGIDIINKAGRTKEGTDILLKEGLLGVKYKYDDNKFKATNYVVFDPNVLQILNKN
jgi:hypothetical protein